MTRAQVDSLAQGRVWSGRDAYDRGLVDRLGGLREAVAIAARAAKLDPEGVTLRWLPLPKSFAERIAEGLSARVQAWQAARQLPAERAAAGALEAARGLAALHGQVQARLPWMPVLR